MGADGTVNLADSNVRAEWNGTAGGAFANDIIFTGNQIFEMCIRDSFWPD